MSEINAPDSPIGIDSTKQVINWEDWWSDTNVPVMGYDPVQDVLVLLRGSNHYIYGDKDILVYDFRTGSWTKGDTKFSGTDDISNMIIDPLNSELMALYSRISGASLKRFKLYQSATTSSSTVNIETPFYDFGSTGLKKRLYKIKVLYHGTAISPLRITAAYDGATSYSDIFSSNSFTNSTGAGVWTLKEFVVASPIDFANLSIKLYSSGAMTTADWSISEISFIYREKGYR